MKKILLPGRLRFLFSSMLMWAALSVVGRAADVNSVWTGGIRNWS